MTDKAFNGTTFDDHQAGEFGAAVSALTLWNALLWHSGNEPIEVESLESRLVSHLRHAFDIEVGIWAQLTGNRVVLYGTSGAERRDLISIWMKARLVEIGTPALLDEVEQFLKEAGQ